MNLERSDVERIVEVMFGELTLHIDTHGDMNECRIIRLMHGSRELTREHFDVTPPPKE